MLLEAEAVYEQGVLKLEKSLPLVEHQRVTVQIQPQASRMSQDEWRELVLSTAGKWEGEFQRPEQGVFEEREPLS
jgi:predicted DNA-binding antitoxin AbrB/MazE fold protein